MFTAKAIRLILLIIVLFVAVGCGGSEDPTAVPEATEAPVEELTAEPLEEPTAEPMAEPTAEPTKTADVTPEPMAEPARTRLGILRFTDSDTTRAGNYSLQMADVPEPTAGSHYELWLLGSDDQALFLSALTVEDGAISAEGTVEENLLADYDEAVISVQPDSETGSGAPDIVVFEGLVPPEALVHIRHVVVAFAGNPKGQGFVLGAEAQNLIAIEHAGLLQQALADDDLDEARRHAEHVINILDGESGEEFGDWDGDGQAQNPGDGFGVRAYLLGAQEHAELAARANESATEVQLHSEHVVIAAGNGLEWLAEAVDEAERIASSDSVDEAQPFADNLSQLTIDIQAGRDVNGDGNIAPAAGEGAITTAYQHGLLMATFEIFAFEEGGETATSDPPETPAETPQEFVIDMVDFTYSETALTIPAGSTVTWVNIGEFEHSATADDGSFDTGLYGTDEQASITFDQSGSFPYFCTLHGGPDGSGMSGSIIVEDESGQAPPPVVEEEPAEVVVEMLDFTYSETDLSVPAGTKVTWLNIGEFEHSATADDNSFDTGLYGTDEEASITFTEMGTFAYYCSLHGGPGGSGMSAVVTVTDAAAQLDNLGSRVLSLSQWWFDLIL